jgi:hypothetical protein
VDCISAVGSKSTAFGALASTVIVFALLATAGVANCMALPAVSLMLPVFKDKAVVVALSAQQMQLVLARPARLK